MSNSMKRILQFFHRSARGVASRWRNVWFRMLGVRINGYVWLRHVEIPRQWEDVTLEGSVSLDNGVTLLCSGERRRDKIVVRAGAYINRNTILDAHRSIEIGRDVMIGPFCFITDSDHGSAQAQRVGVQAMKIQPVIIEDGAWLGSGVTVLKGVRIGQGAIVGAGSVVTRDVPAEQIAVGVPCRVIGAKQAVPIRDHQNLE